MKRKIKLPKAPLRYNMQARQMTHCQADGDGDCTWKLCPQHRDGEPHKTGRHCPLDDGKEQSE